MDRGMIPCELCGTIGNQTPCDRCAGYQEWASGSRSVDKTDKRRNRVLGRARADLATLPDLVTQLAGQLTERPTVTGEGGGGKVTGSPALIRLDVLHLTDPRRKDSWDGEDPRLASLGDRYGVLATLEAWTRVIWEEMPEHERPEFSDQATVGSETSVLIEVWDWIEDQQWAEELAEDVSRKASQVRSSLGFQREQRFRCITCGNRAFFRFGDDFLVCEDNHETSVRNLEEQQRRRPALPTADIVTEFGITRDRLYSWHKRRQIRPAPGKGPKLWFPWDVLMLLNPDIAAGFEARDTADSEARPHGKIAG